MSSQSGCGPPPRFPPFPTAVGAMGAGSGRSACSLQYRELPRGIASTREVLLRENTS